MNICRGGNGKPVHDPIVHKEFYSHECPLCELIQRAAYLEIVLIEIADGATEVNNELLTDLQIDRANY